VNSTQTLSSNRRPLVVGEVLFDEFEKAHPDVFNILLQILEDGALTDGQGKQVDFTNTIIVMTSYIGAEKLTKQAARIGFTRLVCPKANVKSLPHRGKVEVVGVASLAEALDALF